jgi:transcriptional regulator with XRE-family HTH domain
MEDYFTFGSYISQKRREIKYTLRETALQIGITPVYLSEMENGKKTNPSGEIMQKMIAVLCFCEEETALFYDLHAKANGIVSQDLPGYIMESGIIRKALRKAKKKPATDEDWQGFIDDLE